MKFAMKKSLGKDHHANIYFLRKHHAGGLKYSKLSVKVLFEQAKKVNGK